VENNILSVKDLTICVRGDQDARPIVDGVSFDIKKKSIEALVGGSGSGKTTTGLAMLRLLSPALVVQRGKIEFCGKDLFILPEKNMCSIRGKEIGMVFQEPLNAFNPVFRIGYQIQEVLKCHTGIEDRRSGKKVLEILDVVGIKDVKRIARSYPHQLSGGLRQRAMIAQAIAGNPKLIIADEPTSNLDVTLQARVMDLFRKLKDDLGISVLLITHNLGMVEHLADEIAVLHQGRIVESGGVEQIFNAPKHGFTKKLLDTVRV